VEIADCNSVEDRKVRRLVFGALLFLCLIFVWSICSDAQIIRGTDSNGKTRIILVDEDGKLQILSIAGATDDSLSIVIDTLGVIAALLRLGATEATVATLLLETTYRDSVNAIAELLRLQPIAETFTINVTDSEVVTAVSASKVYATALRSWVIVVTDGIVDVTINGCDEAVKFIDGSSMSAGPTDRLTRVDFIKVSGTPNIYIAGAEE